MCIKDVLLNEFPVITEETSGVYYKKFFDRSRERFQQELQKTQESLVIFAQEHPSKMEDVLLDYFKDLYIDELKSLSEKYGYGFGGEEDEEYINSLLLNDQKASRDELEKKIITKELVDAFINNYRENDSDRFIPEKNLLDFLRKHRDNILAKESIILSEVLKHKENIEHLLFEAIEKGDFPVSLEVAKERMKAVKFLAIDEISASLKEKWGDFVGRNHTVRFSSDIPQDQIYKVLTHEIFHAVSGQIEKLEYSPEYEDNPNLSSNEILKIGVQLNRVNFFTGTPLEHLRWLNEALTEEATAVLIGEELSKSYVDERRLLKLLIEKGIPKEVFFEAYFENFNVSTNKTEHSLPKMKKLFNLMNDTFGKGFLFKLDSYIKENSSKKVSGTTKAIENFDSLLS